MSQSDANRICLGLTADIIAAHVKKNPVTAADLPALIEQVYAALRDAVIQPEAAKAATPVQAPPEPARPAPVQAARKSIFHDYIVCLEDGRKMKTLKRYLRSTYNLTPEQYREKWGLPADYPMVAPSYAERRSALAKQTGLGRTRSAAAAKAPAIEPISPPPPPPTPVLDLPPPPVRESRVEHTAASVFSNFPGKAAVMEEDPPIDLPDEADARKPRRKPFSKQLARSMRR